MEYRSLPRGDGKISTIGIGAGSLKEATSQEIKDIISCGMEQDINLIDTVMSDTSAAESIAQALKGQRDEMIMQMHLGAVYPKETYSRTRVLSKLQRGFDQELKNTGRTMLTSALSIVLTKFVILKRSCPTAFSTMSGS